MKLQVQRRTDDGPELVDLGSGVALGEATTHGHITAGTAMAIRFVDVKPDGTPQPQRSGKADAPPAEREPDAEALETSVVPELPHPRPEPKPKERKKPLR